MSNINDRVAFLKGLAEGMKLSDETNEGKLLLKMLDVLENMAEEITSLRTDFDEMQEYVESIDDDLADMEEYLFDDENEDGYDEDEDELADYTFTAGEGFKLYAASAGYLRFPEL